MFVSKTWFLRNFRSKWAVSSPYVSPTASHASVLSSSSGLLPVSHGLHSSFDRTFQTLGCATASTRPAPAIQMVPSGPFLDRICAE